MVKMKTHLRFGPRSPELKTILAYVLAVFFLLFFALGQRALSGSEDRWGEIARNMLLYKDWFHPIINDEVYFDKPLLSYWLIVIATYFTRELNEFAVRLPSAISALLTLFCTYRIALELFDRQIAKLSVFLVITSYGFLFWSHTASAEQSNLASICAAVAWFVHRRNHTNFSSYLVFYLLCAFGCQLKGLTAIVVPVIVISPFIVRNGRWKLHFNFPHLTALFLSATVFLLPYLGAMSYSLPAGIEAQQNHLSGLDLLIRENIVRFFEPFDHVDPIYCYLYEVPRILFPWMFLFLAAVAHYGSAYKKLDESHRWLIEIIVLVFLFFTFSGSRRWYYILPIMPFCMILVSAYMTNGTRAKLRRFATISTFVALIVFVVILLIVPVAAKIYFKELALPMGFVLGSTLLGIGITFILLLGKQRAERLQKCLRIDSRLPVLLSTLLLVSALGMISVFDFILPAADSYRQLKPFAHELSAKLSDGERLLFFKKTNTALAFYLNSDKAIQVVKSSADFSPEAGQRVVISEEADENALLSEFPSLRDTRPLLRETQILEKLLFSSTRFVAYRLHQTEIEDSYSLP